jgi:hypothetical protein
MADIAVLGNIDLGGRQIKNALAEVSGTAPSSPAEGMLWYDSTNNVLKAYNGTSWDACSVSESALAGDGLVVNGSALDVNTGAGLTTSADAVTVDTSTTPQKYATTIGDNSTTVFELTHNLGTDTVVVAVRDTGTGEYVTVPTSEGTTPTTQVTLTFDTAPTTSQYDVVVIG